MIDNDKQLIELGGLDRMLANSTRIDEIADVRAKLEALRVYAVNIGESREVCNEFAMARIKAERRAGQLLLSLPKRNGARPNDMGVDETTPSPLDFVTKTQSHYWQMIAQLPDDKFSDLMLERVQSGDDITTRFFYKAGRVHKLRTEGVNVDKSNPYQTNGDGERMYTEEQMKEAFSTAFRDGMRHALTSQSSIGIGDCDVTIDIFWKRYQHGLGCDIVDE